jgi:hypothetical protein
MLKFHLRDLGDTQGAIWLLIQMGGCWDSEAGQIVNYRPHPEAYLYLT